MPVSATSEGTVSRRKEGGPAAFENFKLLVELGLISHKPTYPARSVLRKTWKLGGWWDRTLDSVSRGGLWHYLSHEKMAGNAGFGVGLADYTGSQEERVACEPVRRSNSCALWYRNPAFLRFLGSSQRHFVGRPSDGTSEGGHHRKGWI